MGDDELKILIQAVIDEEESLRLMTAQMDHLLSQLNKATKDKLKVGVELDTSKAEKQAAADLGKAKIPDVEAKAEVKVEGTEDLRELAKQAEKTGSSAGNMAAKLYLARTALQVLRKTAREAAQTVTELDKAATNLALATGSGSEEAYGLISQYNALAKEFGATTTQVADAANEWLRQGMTAAETTELIEQSMILSKVGAMESSAATQNLTSAMKGYGLAVADVSGIVDKLTSIDLKAAVTSSDLAVAMSRTASSANIAGVSMDKLLGYIATVEETTQKGAESIGESFKTIFARMGNVKLGKFLDDDGEDISDVEKILSHYGIALRNAQGDFRAFGEVLDEVNDKWSSFAQIDKRAIANAFAGTRQQENFLVLMENYGKALEYTSVAADSAGTALQKFSAYEESIEARTNRFTAAMESLTMNTISSDLAKGLIDAGTAVLEFIEKFGLLKATLASLGVGAAAKGILAISDAFSTAKQSVLNLGTAINTLRSVNDTTSLTSSTLQQLGMMTKGLSDEQIKLVLTSNQLTAAQMQEILIASGLTAKQAAQKLSLLGLVTAEGAATGATWSLSAAMTGLGAAIKSAFISNPIGAIMLGVSALVTATTLIQNAVERSKQKAEELQAKEQELQDESTKLKDRIAELQALADNGTITITEEAELERLQRENGLLEQQIAMYAQLAASKREAAAIEARKEADSFFDSSDPNAGLFSVGETKGLLGLENAINRYQEATEGFEKAVTDGNAKKANGYQRAIAEATEDLSEFQSYLVGLRGELDETADAESISKIDAALSRISTILGLEDNGLSDSLKSAYEAYAKLRDVVGERNANESDEFKTLEAEASKAGLTVEQVTRRYSDNASAAENLAEETEEVSAAVSDLSGKLSDLQTAQSLLSSAAKEQSESGYLSAETYDKLIAASADYADCIEYENGSMQFNTEKAKELTDAKYELQLQEIELAKAQDVERWKVNTAEIAELESRYHSLSDTELAHLDSLHSENGALEANVQKYNVMKSEIIELTGAYKEWLDAQSGPEPGDMYDSLKTAQKAIQEGLDSGKVGTAKYKSALKLLVPENAKADAAAYLSTLERYISDESDGVSNFIHDMVAAGLMIEDGDDVQLVPDTAIEEICEKLHITPEMAKAIFGELEEYDFHFDWEDEDFEIDVNASKIQEIDDQISQIQKRIDDIKNSEVSPRVKMDEINQAKKEIEALSQQKASLGISADTSGTQTALKNVSGELDTVAARADKVAQKKLGTMGSSATITALQNVENRLNRINSIKLQDKSFKVTQVNVGGSIPGFSSAGGTQSAPGGKTLVGELGRELVVSGDRYFTVGDLGAEFVNLKAGDIVFNHEDTEKLLKGLTGVRGQALAQGTAMAGRVSGGGSLSNLSAYKVTSASAVQSQTTATVNVNVKTGAKDLSEALEDQLKTLKEELDDILEQFDFKIFMAEKHNASSKEIIEIYRKMQETVHAQAEKYRKMGVDENNEYIRDLQKQWWEYEEAIREARKDEFDEWLKDSKFSIEAMQNDREGTDKVLESWRTVLKSINDEIAYYTSHGYDMASDEIQDLLKEAWDAEKEIETILKSALDAINDSIDHIQDLYKTLKDAAEEFAETGYISLDAYQEIVNMGVEYMAYLRDENGVLRINRERIEAVLTAKSQQMAVEAALNYVRQIGLALADNETEELKRLLEATEQTSDATWGLVYANLAFLNLTDKQRAAARKNIDSLRAIADNVSANISKSLAAEDSSNAVVDTKDALEDILELTKDLIKHEHDQMLDALDNQLDQYRAIIDAKKESLALTKSELSYNKDIQNRTQEIAQIQARLAALSLDDSREAAIERRKLQEELAEKQAALEEKQRDHAYDLQMASLDKQAEAYEKTVNERKEQIENETSSEQKLYDLAIKKISEEWDTLESQLLAWNTEYGRSLNKDIVASWEAARDAAERYGDYVTALNASGSNAAEEDGKSDSDIIGESQVYEDATRIQKIAEQMQRNSLEWYGATDARRRELEQQNVDLGKELEQFTNSGIYKQNGTWYRADGSTLYSLSEGEVDKALATAMKQNSIAWWTASPEQRETLAKKNKELAGYSNGRITNQNGMWVGADGKPLYTITSAEKETIARQLVAMMKSNSGAWASASESGRQELADENVRLAKSVASLLNASVTRDNNGVWYIDGKPLYDVYHKGGVVGGGDRRARERFAMLEKGEMVLADKHFKAIDQMIEMAKYFKARAAALTGHAAPSTAGSSVIEEHTKEVQKIVQARKEPVQQTTINQIEAPLNVNGYTDAAVMDALKQHKRNLAELVADEFL